MTYCIIKSPQLFPNENLNISGSFDLFLFFCVCSVVVMIIAISPSLNLKIDLKKKRQNSLFRVSKKAPSYVQSGGLFVYSLNGTAQPRRQVHHNGLHTITVSSSVYLSRSLPPERR